MVESRDEVAEEWLCYVAPSKACSKNILIARIWFDYIHFRNNCWTCHALCWLCYDCSNVYTKVTLQDWQNFERTV